MKYQTKSIVKFNLKPSTNPDKPQQIMLIMNHKGDRLRYYTGNRILKGNWNVDKQRAKASYSKATSLNAILDKLSSLVVDELNNQVLSGKPVSINTIKEELFAFQNKRNVKGFFEHYEEFLLESKNIRAEGMIKTFRTARSNIKSFIADTGYKFNYDAINDEFHNSFRDYLINNKGLSNNAITKYIKLLKTYLNWATDKGYNSNVDYQKFKYKLNETPIFFLSWDKLMCKMNYCFYF